MSRTLSLVNHLRERGRSLYRLGCKAESLEAWNRLARFQELPEETAAEMHEYLAELSFAMGRYEEARRRIRAVLMHSPRHPHWHFLLAQCIERDPKRDRQLAMSHYRQAVEHDSEQAEYWANLARCADACGDPTRAEDAAERALALDAESYETVEPLVTMWCGRGQFSRAREVLRTAMFGNPSERRFLTRLERVQFEETLQEQKNVAKPPILPFKALAAESNLRRESNAEVPRLRIWRE